MFGSITCGPWRVVVLSGQAARSPGRLELAAATSTGTAGQPDVHVEEKDSFGRLKLKNWQGSDGRKQCEIQARPLVFRFAVLTTSLNEH